VSFVAVCDYKSLLASDGAAILRPRHLFALLAVGMAVAGQARAQDAAQHQGAAPTHAGKQSEAREWADMLTHFHKSPTPGDPLEQLNRQFFALSMKADQKYFLPISRLYQKLTPGVLGLAIHNFVTNLSEPVIIINDLLQGRGRRGADNIARLVTNTTFGMGGIIDLAKREGLPHRENDFGITLGVWGVKPGSYIFTPLLGPSTTRDSIGKGVDFFFSPLTWVDFPGHFWLEVSTTLAGAFDSRIRSNDQLEAETEGATDPYATIRSDYLQSREAMVRGEEAPVVLPPLDEPEPAAPPASGAPAPAPGAGPSPSASAPPSTAGVAMADAAAVAPGSPIATAPTDEEAANDPDLAMVTAPPADRDLPAASTRLAGL
jgi:phospholipid-binding lipoprotein MlaA